MTRPGTFARFDMVNLATQPRQLVAAFLFVVVAAAATPIPALALPAAGIMVSLQAATTFALDERGRLDTLYATLPTSRAAVVRGRYLTTLALWACVTAVAAAAAVIVPLLRSRPVHAELLPPMLVAGFAIVALAVSLQLPFFFAVGYTRARPMTYAPVAVIAAIAYLAGRLDLLPADLTSSTTLSGAAVVAIGLALLGVSARVATTLYTRRQL